MTAKASLQAAVEEHLTAIDGSTSPLSLFPAITDDQLDGFQRAVGQRQIPAVIRDLLGFATGFRFAPVGTVDFLGRDLSVETFFHSVPLLGDGFGNFWILDAEPRDRWAAVLFWCHDPAVVVIQAPTLPDFLEQVFDLGRPGHQDVLTRVRKENSRRIWADDSYVIPIDTARQHADPVVAAFARTLPDTYGVVDLRKLEIGTGFSWGRADAPIRRSGEDLVFGVEKNTAQRHAVYQAPTILSRWLMFSAVIGLITLCVTTLGCANAGLLPSGRSR